MTEIREDYTEEEIARLTKTGKRGRWAVTLVFKDETMHTTKWFTSKEAAKKDALEYLKAPMERQPCKHVYLSNQADFNEEIDLL